MGANHGGSGRAGPHEEEEQQAGVAAELMVLRSILPSASVPAPERVQEDVLLLKLLRTGRWLSVARR